MSANADLAWLDTKINVPEVVIDAIANNESAYYQAVRNEPNARAIIDNLITGVRGEFGHIFRYSDPADATRKKFLEIGSGNGFLLCTALKAGLDIHGVEPGNTTGFSARDNVAITLLRSNAVKSPEERMHAACAENLPFPDNTFDVVFSFAVLEHVVDIDKAMAESIRVLKPGGLLLANMPNYNSFYEGHYNTFWLPYMGKTAAKFYVRHFLRRSETFLDELHFTTPRLFVKYLDGKLTSGRIVHYGTGFTGKLLHYRNLLTNQYRENLPPPRSSVQRYFRSMKSPVYRVAAKLLIFAGFATTFDLVLVKRNLNT